MCEGGTMEGVNFSHESVQAIQALYGSGIKDLVKVVVRFQCVICNLEYAQIQPMLAHTNTQHAQMSSSKVDVCDVTITDVIVSGDKGSGKTTRANISSRRRQKRKVDSDSTVNFSESARPKILNRNSLERTVVSEIEPMAEEAGEMNEGHAEALDSSITQQQCTITGYRFTSKHERGHCEVKKDIDSNKPRSIKDVTYKNSDRSKGSTKTVRSFSEGYTNIKNIPERIQKEAAINIKRCKTENVKQGCQRRNSINIQDHQGGPELRESEKRDSYKSREERIEKVVVECPNSESENIEVITKLRKFPNICEMLMDKRKESGRGDSTSRDVSEPTGQEVVPSRDANEPIKYAPSEETIRMRTCAYCKEQYSNVDDMFRHYAKIHNDSLQQRISKSKHLKQHKEMTHSSDINPPLDIPGTEPALDVESSLDSKQPKQNAAGTDFEPASTIATFIKKVNPSLREGSTSCPPRVIIGQDSQTLISETKALKMASSATNSDNESLFDLNKTSVEATLQNVTCCPVCHVVLKCGNYVKHVLLKHYWGRIHKGDKDQEGVVCETCGNTFKYRRNLDLHEKFVHQGLTRLSGTSYANRKLLQCGSCDFTTREARRLRAHVQSVHMGLEPFRCKHCDFTTRERTALRYHTYRHLKDKPYSCRHCAHACIQRSSMKAHLRKIHGIVLEAVPSASKGSSDEARAKRTRVLEEHAKHMVVKLVKGCSTSEENEYYELPKIPSPSTNNENDGSVESNGNMTAVRRPRKGMKGLNSSMTNVEASLKKEIFKASKISQFPMEHGIGSITAESESEQNKSALLKTGACVLIPVTTQHTPPVIIPEFVLTNMIDSKTSPQNDSPPSRTTMSVFADDNDEATRAIQSEHDNDGGKMVTMTTSQQSRAISSPGVSLDSIVLAQLTGTQNSDDPLASFSDDPGNLLCTTFVNFMNQLAGDIPGDSHTPVAMDLNSGEAMDKQDPTSDMNNGTDMQIATSTNDTLFLNPPISMTSSNNEDPQIVSSNSDMYDSFQDQGKALPNTLPSNYASPFKAIPSNSVTLNSAQKANLSRSDTSRRITASNINTRFVNHETGKFDKQSEGNKFATNRTMPANVDVMPSSAPEMMMSSEMGYESFSAFNPMFMSSSQQNFKGASNPLLAPQIPALLSQNGQSVEFASELMHSNVSDSYE